jgi:multiple sugar transport system permease protein
MADVLARRSGVGRVLIPLALAVAALITLFPFYTMLIMSLKPVTDLSFPKALLPTGLTTEAYRTVLGGNDMVRWIINTLIYSLVSVVLVLLLASMAGYAFAKKRFPGRNAIFWSFLAMLMVPYHITLIPTFVILSHMNGVSTYWGLIVPTLANAQATFLMRQFIYGIPDSIMEAARMDGASDLRIFFQLVLPLCRPILATLGLFVFLWHWNDFLWPLVIGQEPEMRTLTTGIAGLMREATPLNVTLAGSVVALVPIFLAYLLAQRHFTEGVAMTGVKG